MRYAISCKYAGGSRYIRMHSYKTKRAAKAAVRRAKRVKSARKLLCTIRKEK